MKIGLVGCGAAARRGHLPALKNLGEVDVVAVADENFKVAKGVAKEFKVSRCYKNFRLILNNGDIDTVVIATPTTTHAMIAVESAKAGKHIVVEKPLAMNLSECYAIERAVKENDVMLSLIQNYRYFPSLNMSKCKLSRGYFGKILTFYGVSQTRYPSSWTSGTWLYHEKGVLLDFAPHLVDAVLWLMNNSASSVYAVGGDFTRFSGFINYANILVKLENGVSGFLEASWLANAFAFSMDIKGTGGLLKIDVNRDHYEELYGSQTPVDDAKHFTRYMVKVFKDVLTGNIFDKAMKVYADVYRDIIKGFKEGKVPIPIEDGIKTLAVLEATYLSIKERRVIPVKELVKSCELS